MRNKRSTKLDILYWTLIFLIAFLLFVEKYAAGAFFSILIIVIYLSEIATYLCAILVLLESKAEE